MLDILIITHFQIICCNSEPDEVASFLPEDLKKQNCPELSLLVKLDLCFSPHLMTSCTKLVYKTVEAQLHFLIPRRLLHVHQRFSQKLRFCCSNYLNVHCWGNLDVSLLNAPLWAQTGSYLIVLSKPHSKALKDFHWLSSFYWLSK